MSASARRDISSSERAISALAGYCMGSFVVVPFDRVKTLMQAAPGASPTAMKVWRGVFASAGVRGLYRGLDTQLLIAPYTVLYYTIYDEFRRLSGDHRLAPLGAAICARSVEVTLRMPLELLRTQLQAAPEHVTLLGILRAQRHQPLASWMQGYSPTMIRDVPFSAIYWFGYEEAKLAVPERLFENPGINTLVHSFACGGVAGMFAAFVTTPVDVVKTLRQKLHTGTETAAADRGISARSAPASAAYRDILRFLSEHPRRALTGLGPRLLRIPLGLATMMSGIETCKWAFEYRRLGAGA